MTIAPAKRYLCLHLAVGALVILLGSWLFGSLIDAVLDNAGVVAVDRAAATWIHSRTSPPGLITSELVSLAGSPPAMILLGVAGAIVLWREHDRILTTAWVVAFAGGGVVDWAVKTAVHRNRPPFASAYLHATTFSFPSGHSMGSLIGYGMTVFAIESVTRPSPRVAWSLRLGAAVLVAAVGGSRLYLGVHYPSDVLGGYAAGAVWMSVCASGSILAKRRSSAG